MKKIISDRIDNWCNFNYLEHLRYLDNLASVFSVQRPCAAITQDGKLSYNDNKYRYTDKKVNKIKNSIKQSDLADYNELLALYLVLNIEFRDPLLQVGKYDILHSKIKDKIQQLCTSIRDEKQYWEKYSHFIGERSQQKIIGEYFDILDDPYLTLIPKELILRPLQDITKILRIKENINCDLIVILDNQGKLHAEINARECVRNNFRNFMFNIKCYSSVISYNLI